MPGNGNIRIGTSSWADPGFVERWYPEGMPARERLPWYAERFDAVEVNSTFYAVPDRKTVERWAKATPDGFTFDYKLHRLLSRHAAPLDSMPKDLRGDVEVNERGRVRLTAELEAEVARRILEAAEPLAEAGKLGAFLLQLTPAFAPGKSSLDELEPLIESFRPWPVAVELRHKGWVEGERAEETFGRLSDMRAPFVCVDSPPGDHVPILPPVDAVTRDELAYLRAHGRNTDGYLRGKTVAERFGWIYSDEELRDIQSRAERLAEDASEVHVMFNNNRDDDAPSAARRLKELLGQNPGPPPGDPQLSMG